jgi:hypothetical protein
MSTPQITCLSISVSRRERPGNRRSARRRTKRRAAQLSPRESSKPDSSTPTIRSANRSASSRRSQATVWFPPLMPNITAELINTFNRS